MFEAMIQPIALAGAGLCLWVLYMRYRSTPKNRLKSTRAQKLKLAKVLIVALLALMAITYSMRRLGDNLDGKVHERTLVERMVTFLTK
jgi:hypothetical protein